MARHYLKLHINMYSVSQKFYTLRFSEKLSPMTEKFKIFTNATEQRTKLEDINPFRPQSFGYAAG